MPKRILQRPVLTRQQKLIVVKLARSGMQPRTVAKRAGAKVAAVREFMKTLDQ